jgi:hypothetical protein
MRARRSTLILSAVLVFAVPGIAAAGAENPLIQDYRSGSSSVIEAGLVTALPAIQRDVSEFTRPVDPTAAAVDHDGPRLTGLSAITLTPAQTDFTSLDSTETLTGPNDEYLTRIGFGISSRGTASFYGTRTNATLYLAEFTGEPVAPDDGVFGVSLGLTWPGEEVLLSESSFFANDPLVGYAHSVEYGEAAGQTFDYYASVENQEWVQYSNPLIRVDGPIVRDRNAFWVGWVVPGVPEKAAVTLSYADDPTDPETLISQQLVFEVPQQVMYSALEFEFSSLSEEEQQALVDRWAVVLAAADDTETTTTSTSSATTTSEATTTTTPVATAAVDDGGLFSSPVAWFLGLLLLLFLAGLLSAWLTGRPGFFLAVLPDSARGKQPDRSEPEFYGTMLDASKDDVSVVVEPGDGVPGEDDGPPSIDWGGPPGSEVVIEESPQQEPEPDWSAVRADKGAANQDVTRTILEWHEREGGPVFGEEWIAPSEHTMTQARYGGEGTGRTEWSGTFINVRTGEWVEEPDPLHRELRNRFGIRPDATGTGDAVVPS